MKKPYRFDKMSDITCDCGKSIKLNILIRKPDTKICFECYRDLEQGRSHSMTTGKEIRTGKKIGRKKGIYGVQ